MTHYYKDPPLKRLERATAKVRDITLKLLATPLTLFFFNDRLELGSSFSVS